jgi:hypothetical protein
MAELALGVVGLAGLFNNTVDSYGYIRLGQHYARDFETSQMKLDLSRLQLSRWGAALGLDGNPTQARSLHALSVAPHEVQQAEAALAQITDLLEGASAASHRFEAHYKQSGTTVALNPNDLALHKKISWLVLRRLPKTAVIKKPAWALYGKNDLDRLVSDITELTNQLVSLFPARASVQKELCAEEMQEIDDSSLPLVAEVADQQDPLVADAARSLMQARGHTYTAPHARGGASQHVGDHIRDGYRGAVGGLSHTYDRPLAEGAGTRQHNGNLYGGCCCLCCCFCSYRYFIGIPLKRLVDTNPNAKVLKKIDIQPGSATVR